MNDMKIVFTDTSGKALTEEEAQNLVIADVRIDDDAKTITLAVEQPE